MWLIESGNIASPDICCYVHTTAVTYLPAVHSSSEAVIARASCMMCTCSLLVMGGARPDLCSRLHSWSLLPHCS